jgi:16S rRNA (cytosine1402-N4)-methyltransferase
MNNYHKPVLLEEVLEYLDPREGDVIVDATFGFGGHSKAILEKIGKSGKIIGFEQDKKVFKLSGNNLDPRITLINQNFAELKSTLKEQKIIGVDKILFDLGISSYHFDKLNLGFSFDDDELDMRLNRDTGETAADLVNLLNEQELADLLYKNANEFLSRRIARLIVEARKRGPINSAVQLREIIEKGVRKRGKINPATKTFQALRVAVNDELGVLERTLPEAIDSLKKEGRIAVISFHSLEDRVVKNIFKDLQAENLIKVITKKPLVASAEEIKENPRSRSAKLRAAIKQ